MRRKPLITALVVLASLGLSSCAGAASGQPDASGSVSASPTDAATPSATALTDEQALQIGVETFKALLDAEQNMYRTRGASVAEFEALLTENLDKYRKNVIQDSANDYTVHGQWNIYKPKLQSASDDSIVFYACLKLDEAYVTDANGEVVGGERTGKIGSVEIEIVPNSNGKWIVERKQKWEDPEHCSSLS